MAAPPRATTPTLDSAESQLIGHLARLGLDSERILAALPLDLTLSSDDGVLSLGPLDREARDLAKLNLHVDFIHGALAHRSAQHLGGEHLIKACRIKKQTNVHVLDATCGMGKDSFLLHQAGFQVTAVERHPVTHALLCDGIQRWAKATNSDPFKLHWDRAETWIAQGGFDVIYLDPMFPNKQKSAKSKKDMQLFQSLHLAADDRADELLQAALDSPCQKVVIKRPTKSPFLLGRVPTFQVSGKTCRFDVYQQA